MIVAGLNDRLIVAVARHSDGNVIKAAMKAKRSNLTTIIYAAYLIYTALPAPINRGILDARGDHRVTLALMINHQN